MPVRSASAPVRAMVFAAGRGVRMGPLTRCRAKPALPFCGVPLLTRILRRLRRSGVSEVVVNLHHRPESLTPLLAAIEAEDGPPFRVRRSEEEQLLGTSGGLSRALASHALGDGSLFVMNGDTLATVELSRMAAFHRDAGGEATLLCDPEPGPEFAQERRILTDRRGRLTGLGAAGGPGYGFCGVWILEPGALRHLSGEPVGLSRDLLAGLIETGSGRVYPSRAPWFEIGTPRRYLSASLAALGSGAVGGRDVAEVRFGAGSEAVPAALVGRGSVLGSGARVERSILLEDVRVGDRAVVRRSVVARGERVPEGARIEDALFADGRARPLG